MRWFRFGASRKQVQPDPGRQASLRQDVRQRFGAQVQVRFADQAEAVGRLLSGDEGLTVAAEILRECADEASADLLAQAADLHGRTGQGLLVDRRNYQPLWREAGPALRWPMFALPCGLHPYVQLAAAVTVIGAHARRAVRVTDPDPLLVHVFEVLDLTAGGWQYGGVRVDVDAAALGTGLIATARELRDAMGDPPPLPPAVRELMRRNNTIDVYDAGAHRIAGTINPGAQLRQALLT